MRRVSLLLLPPLTLVVLLWLPFGFQMGALVEEWGLLGLYAEYGPMFIAGAHSLMPQHQMRPVMTTLWAIAYQIDPNSWWFWHVELMLSLLLKGASMTWLVFYLTRSTRWAVVAGLLFIVWPADVMQMAFRAMPISFSVGITSTTAALFIAAHLTTRVARRWLLATVGACCIVIGAWTYEVTLILAPLPYVLLATREGFIQGWTLVRRSWQASVMWLAAVGLCVIYILWVSFTAKNTYQQGIASDRNRLLAAISEHLPMLFTRGLARTFFGGWLDAARIAVRDISNHGYLIATALVVALIIVWCGRRGTDNKARGKVLVWAAIAGLTFVAMSYAPFLVSMGHLNTSERTFMFAALGGTLVLLAMLMWVDRLSRSLALLAAVAFVSVGAAQQLWQFREYAELYERQRNILAAIIEQAPNGVGDKTLIILDASQQLNQMWMLDGLIPSAMTYLYGRPVRLGRSEVCFPQSGVWPVRDAAAQQGECFETDESWIFRSAPLVNVPGNPTPRPPDIAIPKSKAVVVRINQDGRAPQSPQIEANRAALLAGEEVVSKRYRHALAPSSWPSRLRLLDRQPSTSYRWDFGRRWNMQQATGGAGWTDVDWTYAPIRQVSGVWMNKTISSLVFELAPADTEYEMRAHLLDLWEGARSATRARVNGVEVPVAWTSSNDILAPIPRSALKTGSNLLEFETARSPSFYAVSLHFDWVTIGSKR